MGEFAPYPEIIITVNPVIYLSILIKFVPRLVDKYNIVKNIYLKSNTFKNQINIYKRIK